MDRDTLIHQRNGYGFSLVRLPEDDVEIQTNLAPGSLNLFIQNVLELDRGNYVRQMSQIGYNSREDYVSWMGFLYQVDSTLEPGEMAMYVVWRVLQVGKEEVDDDGNYSFALFANPKPVTKPRPPKYAGEWGAF